MQIIPKALQEIRDKENPMAIIPLSGGYHELTVEQKEIFDKMVSSSIIDEAVKTLKQMSAERPSADYRDLSKTFSMLLDAHRRIEGKDRPQNNVQVNISLADTVKRVSEQVVKEVEITEQNS